MKITVIGAATIDILVDGFKDLNHKYVDEIKFNYGGDGLNQSLVLKKFGLDVDFLTTIGKDEAGENLKNYLISKNINIIPSYTDKTYICIILNLKKEDNKYLSTKDGSIRDLSLADIKFPLDGEIVSFASMFISNKLDKDSYEILFKKIKDENKILCVNTKMMKNNEYYLDFKNSLKYIDYFFPNEKEACYFTRTSNLKEAANKLYEAGVSNVLIKASEKGCYLKNKDYDELIPTNKVEVIDPTGAGDSFVGAFIYCLSQNKDIIEAIKFANNIGGKAVSSKGLEWLNK